MCGTRIGAAKRNIYKYPGPYTLPRELKAYGGKFTLLAKVNYCSQNQRRIERNRLPENLPE